MKGTIKGEVIKGKYKGEIVDIKLGKFIEDCDIKINGKSIANIVESLNLFCDAKNDKAIKFEIKFVGCGD